MFENKKRLHKDVSLRAYWWDYRKCASYFITICLQPRVFYFGIIQNQVMCISDAGAIAHQLWEEIPIHFPFVRLGEFIIMPDHMHGILTLDPSDSVVFGERPLLVDSNPINQRMSNISPMRGSLGSVIRSYKSGVSKEIHKIHPDFRWQSLYHDRIIRNEEEYSRISDYICSNPIRWTNPSM